MLQYSTDTPEPSSCLASQPSPLTGRNTTVSRPDDWSAEATSATTRSAPPGPSDEMSCAMRPLGDACEMSTSRLLRERDDRPEDCLWNCDRSAIPPIEF